MYPGALTATEGQKIGMFSLSERLKSQIQDGDRNLQSLRRAVQILDKNPELKELLDILLSSGIV